MTTTTYTCPKCDHESENPDKEYGKTIINLFCEECCQRYMKLVKMRKNTKLKAQKRYKGQSGGDMNTI